MTEEEPLRIPESLPGLGDCGVAHSDTSVSTNLVFGVLNTSLCVQMLIF